MLLEVRAEPMERAAVSAGSQSLDDTPRRELEIIDRGDDGGREGGGVRRHC
jgi:hypothetical protein